MKKIIGLVGILIMVLTMDMAAAVKTYIYKPQNPQSEIYEIYIDTDGKIYSKNSSATLVRLDSNYTLPLATTTVRGGNKIGLGLTMTGDSIGINLTAGSGISISSATITNSLTAGDGLTRTAADIDLDAATETTIGGVMSGLGLSMSSSTMNINLTAGTGLTLTSEDFSLDLASTSARGGVKVGYGLTMTGDSLGLTLSGTTQTFTASDATPTVAGYTLFFTAASGTVTITDFDDGTDGQEITVIGNDNFTTIDMTSSSIIGSSADITLDTDDVLTFIYCVATEKWYLKSFVNVSADNSTGF